MTLSLSESSIDRSISPGKVSISQDKVANVKGPTSPFPASVKMDEDESRDYQNPEMKMSWIYKRYYDDYDY